VKEGTLPTLLQSGSGGVDEDACLLAGVDHDDGRER
jgi:hypothetical protein